MLHAVGALEHMTDFVQRQYTDVYLPFTDETLPDFIQDEQTRRTFLERQASVLTDARALELGASHVHFEQDADEHFHIKEKLGSGGFG